MRQRRITGLLGLFEGFLVAAQGRQQIGIQEMEAGGGGVLPKGFSDVLFSPWEIPFIDHLYGSQYYQRIAIAGVDFQGL